jgi:hypothetical protein
MSVKITGLQLDKLAYELMNADISMQRHLEMIAIIARSTIMERLSVHLKTGAEHFNVTIRPNSLFGWQINVSANDEVGMFLFQGVEPHQITGVAMPLGNGQFAEVVNHPGFDSRSDKIWAAVIEGMAIAVEVAQGV